MELLNKFDRCKTKLKHYEDSTHTAECPQCNFTFNLNGVTTDNNILKLKEFMQVINLEGIENDKLLTEIDLQVEEINIFRKTLGQILNIKRSSSQCFEFWDSFKSDREILSNQQKVQNNYQLFKSNILFNIKRKELLEELSACQKTINAYTKYGSGIDKKLVVLHSTLDNNLIQLNELQTKLDSSKKCLRYITYFDNIFTEVDIVLDEVNYSFRLAIDDAIQKDARYQCDLLYNDLADNTDVLNKFNNLQQNIIEMDSEFIRLSDMQACLLLLEENLSPTKGMIADEMMNFISSYIEQINLICEEIWGYKLELGLCNMDNGVLDYNFPLIVENEIVDDIKMASKGQAEIINLAFTMVMRQYLNLNGFGIYFDEIGQAFDEFHRRKLFDYIKSLQSKHLCSQIFMINHYTVNTGGLVNHDVVVLDDRNIVVPNHYNANVKIVYRGE